MLSIESLQFLQDLKANNNRDWFLANKKRYETYKQDYQQLVQSLLDTMKPLDPDLALLEAKNCTFRINRDIRFSKDKTPYKDHLGIWLSGGTKGTNRPGYYIQISPDGAFIAGGLHSPEAADLKKIRKEIAFYYDDLNEIIDNKNFKKEFSKLDNNDVLKNAPKDYEKDHPAIELLKLKSFTATQTFDYKNVLKGDFVAQISKKLITLKPLNDFLNRALTMSGE